MKIEIAGLEQLTEINEMYEAIIQDLNSKGMFQWDQSYPNIDYFRSCINNEEMYVLLDNQDGIHAAVVINQWEAPEWDMISWSYGPPALVIHALAVRLKNQGQGYGKKMMAFIEDWAKNHGFNSIRLDVFSENQPVIRGYENLGFIKAGTIHISSKPKGHETYYCYEKTIQG